MSSILMTGEGCLRVSNKRWTTDRTDEIRFTHRTRLGLRMLQEIQGNPIQTWDVLGIAMATKSSIGSSIKWAVSTLEAQAWQRSRAGG